MRRHCWSALALVLGLGLAGSLAGCGGPRGFYASDPPRIPLGGNFTVQPGQDVIVSGVRSKRCGMEAPAFEAARSEEVRVGNECVRPCRSRWSPYHKKKTKIIEEDTPV